MWESEGISHTGKRPFCKDLLKADGFFHLLRHKRVCRQGRPFFHKLKSSCVGFSIHTSHF